MRVRLFAVRMQWKIVPASAHSGIHTHTHSHIRAHLERSLRFAYYPTGNVIVAVSLLLGTATAIFRPMRVDLLLLPTAYSYCWCLFARYSMVRPGVNSIEDCSMKRRVSTHRNHHQPNVLFVHDSLYAYSSCRLCISARFLSAQNVCRPTNIVVDFHLHISIGHYRMVFDMVNGNSLLIHLLCMHQGLM